MSVYVEQKNPVVPKVEEREVVHVVMMREVVVPLKRGKGFCFCFLKNKL
jgi:hypothetical protein